ncbi:hypothetical protein GEMRC1_006982 [Eukaryota sp. GEM-RC1]
MRNNRKTLNRYALIFGGVLFYAITLCLVWGHFASPQDHVVRNAYGQYFVDGTPIVNFESCAEQAKKEGLDPTIASFQHDIPGIDEILEANAVDNKDIVLVVTNSGFADLTSNFLCCSDKLGISNIVLATTDEVAAKFYTEQNRPVIFDPLRTFGSATHKFGSEGHRSVASSKMFYVYEVLRLLFDKNVFAEVKANHPCDLAIQSDSPPPYNSKIKLNTGFFYIRSNARTLRFLEKVMLYRLQHPDKHEQEALNNVLANKEECISVCVLDRYRYPNGHMYFTYKLVEKAEVEPKMVHVNYYQFDSKVALLKHYNWWFIDENRKCVN